MASSEAEKVPVAVRETLNTLEEKTWKDSFRNIYRLAVILSQPH